MATSRTRHPLVRLAAAAAAGLVALLVVLVGTTGPASGHAALTGSDPADGARLDAEPSTVSLEFNEPVKTPAFVVVDAPDGSRLTSGEAEVVDGTVTQTVRAAGQAGSYRLAYRIVSADGHPISGTIGYEITSGETVDPSEAAAAAASSSTGSDDGSFLQRHGQHVAWGVGGVVVAGALLLWPLRRSRG